MKLPSRNTPAAANPAGAVELWTIGGGGHIPSLSDTFNQLVIEWLLAHPKSAHGEAAD